MSANFKPRHDPSIPVIVLGAGGHAAVVISSLRRLELNIIGITTADNLDSDTLLGIPVLGDDNEILRRSSTSVLLANGIGATLPGRTARHLCAEKMRSKGFKFLTLIDASSICVPEVAISEGVQIMAGAVIQPRVSIGKDSIINTGARVDHDCEIGVNCHICPGVTLAGGVRVDSGTILGAGTTVIPGVSIGSDSIVGAGSVIFEDIPPRSRVIQRRIDAFDA